MRKMHQFEILHRNQEMQRMQNAKNANNAANAKMQ